MIHVVTLVVCWTATCLEWVKRKRWLPR